ncbi:MAG TPA: hypothetical protein VFQ25_10100 [Ktedonobacterales bacterium]|nr:hypothetical protein [Ktedonobacterales bacterium]
MISKNTPRAWAPALALLLAGVCFVLYPAIRPYSDEASLRGAAAFASSAWLLAHSLAMVGFILLMLGLLGLYSQLRATTAGGLGLAALVVTWVGVGLTLPYYGAEAFALHAVGQEALKRRDVDLYVTLTNAIRFGEGIWFFGVGLLALAVGVILFAIAIWRSGVLPRWSGIPLAVAFALFIPQFYTPPLVRVGHGLLILVGCALIAWALLNRGDGARRRA